MESIDNFLKTVGALYDETRVKLLKFLYIHGPLCVCDLQNSFNMIQSRLSRHLKILKDAGFLKNFKNGRQNYYAIKSPIDKFKNEALKEILALPMELPKLKRKSKKCDINDIISKRSKNGTP